MSLSYQGLWLLNSLSNKIRIVAALPVLYICPIFLNILSSEA